MSLVLTRMQNLRASYPNGYDKNELRYSALGAWEFFKSENSSGVGIFNGDIRSKIKASFGNTVVVPVLNAEDVTIGNVRSCTIADSENTSALVTLTLATYAFGFTMTPSRHKNNDISYQSDFDRKMRKYIDKLGRTLDTQCVTTVEAAKNTFAGDLADYYTFSGGALQVDDDEKDDFYNQLEAIMNSMDFYGKTKVLSSTSGKPIVSRIAAQGTGNAENLAYQLAGYQWWYTNRIANAGGIKSTKYAIQEGSVAFETRLDPDAEAGARIGDASNPLKEWGRATLPDLGIEVGTFYTRDCSDRTVLDESTEGLSRTLLEGYEFSFDICFATAYNSDPTNRHNPILKAEIAAP